ncbi:type II toxin-antitoxin system prevent-host-death family antitoxin [Acinetobacter baumannii]
MAAPIRDIAAAKPVPEQLISGRNTSPGITEIIPAVIISKASYEAYKKAEYDVAYYKISASKENSEA